MTAGIGSSPVATSSAAPATAHTASGVRNGRTITPAVATITMTATAAAPGLPMRSV
jgi:hypothetical protein